MKDALRRVKKSSRALETLRAEAAELRKQVNARAARRPLKKPAVDVTRAEFEAIVSIVGRRGEAVERLMRDVEVQFHRIAQLQATVDRLQAQVSRLQG
jgi:cell division protein FtsB